MEVGVIAQNDPTVPRNLGSRDVVRTIRFRQRGLSLDQDHRRPAAEPAEGTGQGVRSGLVLFCGLQAGADDETAPVSAGDGEGSARLRRDMPDICRIGRSNPDCPGHSAETSVNDPDFQFKAAGDV